MLTRWKILACSLTVGVGGLAVFADPPADIKKDVPPVPPPLPKLTVKPDSPPNGTDTPAPPAGTKPGPGLEFDLDLAPVPPAPAKAPELKLPDAKDPKPAKLPEITLPDRNPDVPPLPIIPVKGEETKPAVKKDEPKPMPKPEGTLVPPPPDLTTSPLPSLSEPKAPAAPLPPPAVKDVPPLPSVKPADPLPVPGITHAPAVESEPARIPPPTAPATKAEGAKLKMLLRMGDGNPRFEIRNSATTELLLKVYGDKIELQAPTAAKTSLAGVSAAGKVRFTAPGIEGHCDSLKILSATGEVLLEGNIRLKSRGGKAWRELTAEKMVYQIGNAGLSAPKTPVRAAGFIPE